MNFPPELIDELLKDYRKPEDLMGEGGIFKQLTKALIERCLSAELDTHLAQEKSESTSDASGEGQAERPRNRRNGQFKKTIKGEFGEAEIGVPRDRNGAFEPQLIPKGQTRFNGFDDKILSLYARGMTTRDIQAQLQELYGVEVSHTLISNVTEAVEQERKLWQNRSLDAIYPIVYLDAIVVKVRPCWTGYKQSHSSGVGGEFGRAEGVARAMDDSERILQVLALSADGTAKSGR